MPCNGSVGQAVAVVRQEHLLVTQERLDGLEPLADVRREPVSTKVIRQSWMSLLEQLDRLPPSDKTKSFEIHSL